MLKILIFSGVVLILGAPSLFAQCPEALLAALRAEARFDSKSEAQPSETFPLKDWLKRVYEFTQNSYFDSKMRHPQFETEIQIIRYNFFRLPLSSIEEILDFMTSQLETRWGSLWMNEIQLIRMTVEHIQAQSQPKLLQKANEIEAAIRKRLPLKFSPAQRSFDARPSYNYHTEW